MTSDVQTLRNAVNEQHNAWLHLVHCGQEGSAILLEREERTYLIVAYPGSDWLANAGIDYLEVTGYPHEISPEGWTSGEEFLIALYTLNAPLLQKREKLQSFARTLHARVFAEMGIATSEQVTVVASGMVRGSLFRGTMLTSKAIRRTEPDRIRTVFHQKEEPLTALVEFVPVFMMLAAEQA